MYVLSYTLQKQGTLIVEATCMYNIYLLHAFQPPAVQEPGQADPCTEQSPPR